MAIKSYDKELKVTASFGISGFTANPLKQGFSADILLDCAYRNLCLAREEGGDMIKGVQIG